MSLEQQQLEDFFQNIKPSDGLPGDFDPNDGKGEFDSFFEKLSTLEDLTWNDEDEPGAVPTETVHRQQPAQRAAKPQPKVFHTSRQSAPRRKPATAATESIKRKSTPAATGVAKTLGKFVLMAMVLFSVGMGAGWLALSLPDRFGRSPETELAKRMQQDEVGTPAEVNAADAKNAQVDAISVKGEQKTQTIKLEETTAATPVKEAALPVATPVPAAPVTPPVGDPTSPIVRTPPATKKEPLLSSAGGYSLQVGACQSEACVARYRKMLQDHVAADQIQVIRKTVGDEGRVILRVRIAPMEKTVATELKARLANVDRRLKDAYLTVVN